MKSLLRKVDVPSAVGAAGVVITALYAYWATGLEPFTGLAYIAVGVPVVLLAGVAVIGGAPILGRTARHGQGRSRYARCCRGWCCSLLPPASKDSVLPWVAGPPPFPHSAR